MGRASEEEGFHHQHPAKGARLGTLVRRRVERGLDSGVAAAREHAVAANAADRSEALRRVRKGTKVGRALLRLARGAAAPEALAAAEAILHETSNMLAPLRDRDAVVATIDRLFAGRNDERARHVARSLSEVLLGPERSDDEGTLERLLVDRAAARLVRLRLAMSQWDFERLADADVIEGVVRSWRVVRRLARAGALDCDSGDSHLMRRRCARLSLQLGALDEVLPRRLQRLRGSLRTVTQSLGDEHDLEMLGDRLSLARDSVGSAAFVSAALELCGKARRRLRLVAAAASADQLALRPRRLRSLLTAPRTSIPPTAE